MRRSSRRFAQQHEQALRRGSTASRFEQFAHRAAARLPDLDAGATGSMTGGGYPDGIRRSVDADVAGRREDAIAEYTRWLSLINCENRQGGILTAKALMKECGVIACEAPRHPFPAMSPAVRSGLLDAARRLDPLVLRCGR